MFDCWFFSRDVDVIESTVKLENRSFFGAKVCNKHYHCFDLLYVVFVSMSGFDRLQKEHKLLEILVEILMKIEFQNYLQIQLSTFQQNLSTIPRNHQLTHSTIYIYALI